MNFAKQCSKFRFLLWNARVTGNIVVLHTSIIPIRSEMMQGKALLRIIIKRKFIRILADNFVTDTSCLLLAFRQLGTNELSLIPILEN